MNPVGMDQYNVHVVYKECGENGNAMHLVWAFSAEGVAKAMQSFYGDDLIAVIIL